MFNRPTKVALRAITTACLIAQAAGASWQDAQYRQELRDEHLTARFQAGLLCELTDTRTGRRLVSIPAEEAAARQAFFGEYTIDPAQCELTQESDARRAVTTLKAPDGTTANITWRLDKTGDLVLSLSARTAQPVDQIRMVFPGCDIQQHTMVTIGAYGVARPFAAPWQGTFSNVSKKYYTSSYNHPLIALFESEANKGWLIEGREPRVGPANLGAQGRRETVELMASRGFPIEKTTTPKLYEVRIRTYDTHWADAVDPYIDWMQEGAGFVALEDGGHHPDWVNDIVVQCYMRVGNMNKLDRLAAIMDPSRVIIGRNVGYRKYRMDYHYPNYEYSDSAKAWIRHARELGFHVGAHFNVAAVGKTQPELVKRFRRGLLVTGVDEDGNETYYGIPGPTRHYYCSPALKDWRDYFTDQLAEAVEAGIDLIYLDESMAPGGNYVVDGMTGVQGTFALMEQIKARYPGVAIETEQFNTLTAYRSDFALSQMPPGHPLSGYIFSKFIKILPEGVMTSPSNTEYCEAYYHYGYMLPGAQIGRRESWHEIDLAYINYGLRPDCRMPCERPASYQDHYTHGVIPIFAEKEHIRYFGLQGDDGVTAYYEKQGNQRGMVLYRPGEEPQWLGARVTGITEWTGTGGIKNWLVYNDEKIMALRPGHSYNFSEVSAMPAERFHIAEIPDDFSLQYEGYLDDAKACYEGQEIGRDDVYFKVLFSSNGRLKFVVPDDYLFFINGQQLEVDYTTNTVTAVVRTAAAGDEQQKMERTDVIAGVDQMVTAAAFREMNERREQVQFSVALAFLKNDTPLAGEWKDLPWQVPPKQRSWHIQQHELYEATADGPARMMRMGSNFWNHVTGRGIIIGRFPDAQRIRMEGGYRRRKNSYDGEIQGKIWINGQEIIALGGGEERPYELHPFNVDISQFAGQYAMVEFGIVGEIRANVADWIAPQFIIEND